MALLLLALGAIGFAASFALAWEKYLAFVEPDRAASCTLNLFVTCSAAMESWQGALLGFPNPYLGVAAFPVVVTTGVVLLTGARLPRWYWTSLLVGTVLGQALVFFLMWTSFYAIVALCPYCMVVWTIMWPLLWYQIVRGAQTGDLPMGAGLRDALVANRTIILVIGYVAAVGWLLLAVGADLVRSF
ncbi:vitamin K epoxide reductase family protein [Myceligenerans sp. TRM 65318]|uniref:Vitamin K epoxide reductase family protein n=2 Tax=Myceligenerans pegani TaxID=2776917 RepID=A0ABR9N241_9MICO|nr:vitamin K epoxide reductase family protein [Myceligenerans sp. TRM 65318]MBE3019994.1 vitamin K epoxide reductase family protein [Myceligenerans sp. TRM 65318]